MKNKIRTEIQTGRHILPLVLLTLGLGLSTATGEIVFKESAWEKTHGVDAYNRPKKPTKAPWTNTLAATPQKGNMQIKAAATTKAKAVATKPTKKTKHIPESQRKETGIASYYSTRTCGKVTASGEPLNDKKLTAAHKKLPFGTPVKITNEKTGKSVVVTITDRGPYIKGRIIDLSIAAAKQIGMIKSGVAKVRIEVVAKSS